jgi:hypothetical protein
VLLYSGECVCSGGVTLDIEPPGNETPFILGDGVGGFADMEVVVCLSEWVYSGGLPPDMVTPCVLGDGAGDLAYIGVVVYLGECV